MTNRAIENIYSEIIELSDLSLQRKLWLNESNDTGLISSYTEVMCSLFDDFSFDEFIVKTSAEMGFPADIIFELDKLRILLNEYEEKGSDEIILNDPEWGKVVNQAKIVMTKWKRV